MQFFGPVRSFEMGRFSDRQHPLKLVAGTSAQDLGGLGLRKNRTWCYRPPRTESPLVTSTYR